jgi:hypothetical protein
VDPFTDVIGVVRVDLGGVGVRGSPVESTPEPDEERAQKDEQDDDETETTIHGDRLRNSDVFRDGDCLRDGDCFRDGAPVVRDTPVCSGRNTLRRCGRDGFGVVFSPEI